MSSAEFAEWLAFNRLEPLPDPWLQTGTIAAATVNLWRGKGKPVEPMDFIPRPRHSRCGQRITAAEQSALFAGLAARSRGS